ncbi:MAG TPA: hypothetical protein VHI78_02060, partial [Bacteroidales bacterium]|nr:hypothetical protein [Bacteroidales bacterium]
ENLLSSSFWNCDWPAKEIKQKVRQYIPDEGTISASQNLIPHFASRKGIHMFPYADRAEYIVILKGSSTYPLSPEAFASELQKFRTDPDWALIMEDDYLLILKRNIGSSKFSPPESLLLLPVPVLQ